MRRSEKEIKDDNVISEILKKSKICRVALFDDEYPYIVPLNYGYRDNCLYFHCATQGKKLDLISKNNKVGFEIELNHEIIKHDISCSWTTKYRSIIGNGTIEIIKDFNDKKAGLDILMEHHGRTDNEYSEKAVENIVVLKLKIEHLSAKQSGNYD